MNPGRDPYDAAFARPVRVAAVPSLRMEPVNFRDRDQIRDYTAVIMREQLDRRGYRHVAEIEAGRPRASDLLGPTGVYGRAEYRHELLDTSRLEVRGNDDFERNNWMRAHVLEWGRNPAKLREILFRELKDTLGFKGKLYSGKTETWERFKFLKYYEPP